MGCSLFGSPANHTVHNCTFLRSRTMATDADACSAMRISSRLQARCTSDMICYISMYSVNDSSQDARPIQLLSFVFATVGVDGTVNRNVPGNTSRAAFPTVDRKKRRAVVSARVSSRF